MTETAQPQTGKTRLTITKAADLADMNRTYFYQKYITPWLLKVHQDERDKKYIALGELLAVTGPLPIKKSSDNRKDNARQQNQTPSETHTDSSMDAVVRVRVQALEDLLLAKDEVLRMKDAQLQQADERERFYQEELRAVRLLAAPQVAAMPQQSAPAQKKKWFFGLF